MPAPGLALAAKAVALAVQHKGAAKALLAMGVVGVAAVAATLITVISAVVGAQASNTCLSGGDDDTGGNYVSQEPSGEALSDIPGNYLELYRSAGEEYGIDWAVIAGIGKVETDHGRYSSGCESGPPTAYGTAKGPMQFIDSTWATAGVDGDGDGDEDVCDPADAIPAAAGYLRDSGAPNNYYQAIYAYNHSQAYVEEVLGWAEEYRAAAGAVDGVQALILPAKGAAAATVRQAAAYLGPREAHAEVQGWDLVDSGQNLDYEDHTAYDSALSHAVDAWNDLGSVSIGTGGSTDVAVGDAYLSPGVGGTTYSSGRILLNRNAMDVSTQNAQNAIVTHEFGHTLRLGHHTSSPSVMQGVTTNSNSNYDVPTDYDREVYYSIWGEPSGAGGTPISDEGGGTGGSNKAVFPLPQEYFDSYTNDWGAARPNGGHEGTDLMAPIGVPEYAITDGTVVEVAGADSQGWNELGGWAIMIEADYSVGPIQAGDLFYYAHREKPELQVGDKVEAGDVVGHVGDSGYGPPGTTGQFPPHLHLGRYDPTGARADAASGAMNPYPLLEWLKKNGGTATGGAGAPGPCPPSVGGPGQDLSGGAPPTPGDDQQATGDAQQVLQEAERYLGTPYVLGGAGFDGIDCSGLTMRAYEAVGIHLPHWDDKQLNYGEPVQGNPQPGDLVFFREHEGGGPATHVGLYYGDGKILHASSYYGEVVVSDMAYMTGYIGARRLL